MRLPVNRIAPICAVVLLSGCLGGGDHKADSVPVGNVYVGNGPASDYPIVIGEAFTIDGVTYKPADTMNYDTVGYAALGQGGGTAITGANKLLPLPSYVEVTSLDSGKTILVRLERRGPMSNDRLVELSPGAAAQLGLTSDRAPVRVRRVNPPEVERSLLRGGQPAPYRMETPKSLLGVLMRKLNPAAPVVTQPAATPSPVPTATPRPSPPKSVPTSRTTPSPMPHPVATATPRPVVTPRPVATLTPVATPSPTAAHGSFVVQIGAFSTQERANATAAKVGGRIAPAGRLFRVRMGPFATQAQANAALAKARAAGYSDARIQHAD
jgi:rare lipoprotein A